MAGERGAGSGGSGGVTATGCPSPSLKAGNTTRMVQVGGKARSYVLHVPSRYDGAKPSSLVVDFHGLGGTAMDEATSSPYPAQTDPDGAVMAFPAGLSGSLGTSWNLGTCCVDADDVGFTRALVADVEKVACIDARHVYAVGFSLGGGMTQYLGCEAADLFAAVAPAAADLVQETVATCKPARPITVITFRGTADTSVKYAGGSVSPNATMPLTGLGARASFDKWAEIDECTGAASAEDKNGCASYTSCAGGAEVILCTKQGGGHEPGNASVAWPVLKRHALP
jgi:polyhydroxybutyrate depolymerase